MPVFQQPVNGGLNTYGYVGGNPLFWIDPMGLAWGIAEGRPWNITHGLKACKPTDDCATLKQKAGKLTVSIAERRGDMVPFSTTGQSASSYVGHAVQISQQIIMLKKCQQYYNNHTPPCEGNCPAYNPYPLPPWKPEPPIKPINSGTLATMLGVMTVPVIIIFGN